MGYKGLDIGSGLSQFGRDYGNLMAQGYKDKLAMRELEQSAEQRRLTNAIAVQNAALSGFGLDPETAPLYRAYGGGFVTPPAIIAPDSVDPMTGTMIDAGLPDPGQAMNTQYPGQEMGFLDPSPLMMSQSFSRAPAAAAPQKLKSSESTTTTRAPSVPAPDMNDFQQAYKNAIEMMRQTNPEAFSPDGRRMHPYAAKEVRDMAMKQLGYMIQASRLAPTITKVDKQVDKEAPPPGGGTARKPEDPLIKGYIQERSALMKALTNPSPMLALDDSMTPEKIRARISEIDEAIAGLSGSKSRLPTAPVGDAQVRIRNKKTGSVGTTSKKKADEAIATGNYELVK